MSNPVVAAPMAQGMYVPCRRVGQLLFVSGVTPRQNGELILAGPIEDHKPTDYYREAVRLAASNALAAARSVLNAGEAISAIASTTCFIACAACFEKHSLIADFASAYFQEALGDSGISARAAIGVQSLPGNAPVELQLIAVVGA